MFRPRNNDPSVELRNRLAKTPALGRFYVDTAAFPYIMPNTKQECQRLNLQHFILHQFLHSNCIAPIDHVQRKLDNSIKSGYWTNHVLDKLLHFNAIGPIQPPRRILDVACGTGRWPFELARQFPLAEVIGIDIVDPAEAYSDNEPPPANYRFLRGNIVQGLSFNADTFDYVHMRFVGAGIPTRNWQMVINELARMAAPGGWVESVEFGLPINGGPAFTRIQAAMEMTLTARGIDLADLRAIDSMLRQASSALEMIQGRVIDVPIGAYGGTIGLQMAWNAKMAMSNMASFYQQVGLFTPEEWKSLAAEAEEELRDTTNQPTQPLYFAIGRKKAN